MEKKVSVIVCTYNAAEDLRNCLASLSEQEYQNIEIIVVNDASTDGSAEVLENCSISNLSVVHNEQNLGVAGSRNAGIQHEQGEIIAFTDADCIADRRWIAELVKGFDEENVVAVGGSVETTEPTNIWELTTKGHDFVSSEEGFVTYIIGCNMSFLSGLFEKQSFDAELKYGYEETLLCDRVIEDGNKIYYRPQARVYHKHRTTLPALFRRKYLLGVSSAWYRWKQKRLLMFKRHIALALACALLPFFHLGSLPIILSVLLFAGVLYILLRDEIMYRAKSVKELLLTFPIIILIEFSHFWGAVVGVMKFRLMKPTLALPPDPDMPMRRSREQ
jgi:glycosyltransferase involved in cell wall biosynthesis